MFGFVIHPEANQRSLLVMFFQIVGNEISLKRTPSLDGDTRVKSYLYNQKAAVILVQKRDILNRACKYPPPPPPPGISRD